MLEKRIILCVDDDPTVLDSLERDLQNDFHVELCESAEEALEVREELNKEGKVIDIYIIDQVMPGMKGIDFMRVLDKEADNAQRMLLTAYADTLVASQGINEKLIDHYAGKPYEKQELKEKIEDLLKARDRGTFVTKARTPEEMEKALLIQNTVFSEEHLKLPYSKGIKIIGENLYQDRTQIYVAVSQRKRVGTTSLSRPDEEYKESFGTDLGLPIEEFYDIKKLVEFDQNLVQVRNATVLRAHRQKGVGPMIWGRIYRDATRKEPKANYAVILAASEIRDPKEAMTLYAKIKKQGLLVEDWKIDLKDKKNNSTSYNISSSDINDVVMPGLLDMYTHINFKFIGEPVYYSNFKMFDFPMLLKIENTNEPYKTWFETGKL